MSHAGLNAPGQDAESAIAPKKAPVQGHRLRSLRPFLIWLTGFYTLWLGLVLHLDAWPRLAENWGIALAMAFGSYFAGSTPMGGGTVGFPVLTLLFDHPASLGRDFGLAVQSVGMVSASLYIFVRRIPLDRALLLPALLGAAIGTPLGTAFIAPLVPDLGVRLTFAVIWAAFGIIHWLKIEEIVRPAGPRLPHDRLDRPLGLAIGVSGGILASLTGVGIDMMIYAVLVLFYRSDLKIAIPTSVVLMAFTSVVGIGSRLTLGAVMPDVHTTDGAVFWSWLAAAPIVALGAPLGSIVVARMQRLPTLLIVSSLCIFQLVWALLDQRVTGWPLLATLGALTLISALFLYLFALGYHSGAAPAATRRPVL